MRRVIRRHDRSAEASRSSDTVGSTLILQRRGLGGNRLMEICRKSEDSGMLSQRQPDPRPQPADRGIFQCQFAAVAAHHVAGDGHAETRPAGAGIA